MILVARHFASITKTNIGTSYTDIYVSAAFAERNLHAVDWSNVVDVRIVWMWDRAATDTGLHQCRWVDQADNQKVLWESPTFNTDQDPGTSGWVPKPSAFTGVITIEWQGKSTVAGDDPIPKGFAIYVR